MGRIDVVGLGPGGADLLTVGTVDLLATVRPAFLRTRRHPASSALAEGDGVSCFDDLYESLDTFEEVYVAIVDALVAAAGEHDRVLYAVPGSPAVAEHTVELLLARSAAGGGSDASAPEVVVHPAMSFLDLAWVRLGIDPVAAAVTLVDAHRFEATRPADGGAVLVAQCESAFTLSDVKLSVDPAPQGPVVVLQRLGLPGERVVRLDWADIDRTVEADHLTSLWVPDLPPTAGGRLEGFAGLMERLRVEDAWKAGQDHHSLKRFLLEEAHEVLEAIDAYDPDSGVGAEELASELGDLLYQVVFHSSLAAEAGWFDLAEVVGAIHDKLEGRQMVPVQGTAPTVADLVAAWERQKVAEHGRRSAFDGIPAELPALLRALKVLRKADALGLEIPTAALGDDTAGRLLAEVVVAAGAGLDPEDELRRGLIELEAALREAEPRATPRPGRP